MTSPVKLSLSNEEYHAHPAIGSTSLKRILRSPAHYRYEMENPSEPTPAMQFGTKCHQALLEPALFEKAVDMPLFEGKGSRAAKEEWLLENHGKMILKPGEGDQIRGMLKAVSKHKTARALLSGGMSEVSLFWKDPGTGIDCKCRPDFIHGGNIVVDVKTTTDASLDAFQRTIARLKYHLSGAHYLTGASTYFGTKFETFINIAIEDEAPWGIHVFELDQPTIEKGEELRRRALLRLAACRQMDQFPGYPEEIVPINLTPWAWAE